MNTTTGIVATDARADVVSLVGTAPDARPFGGALVTRDRSAEPAVAPHPYRGAPAVTAPLSA
ncbi:hypothetical protein EDF64_103124 [Curtobacterium flaccumfaciens]|uniref:Uncharacterized protein n=1 Tax=Curtobacterium flaccumfaciens TaxID=2035 RepID=A0A4R6DKE9_9MICO|nr:hypothetical protein [Curtobacterium flaccumfaciens]TDN45200.1 hypothetical protein EDF64_103124 [Curtobacterium flaccumfaciens]